jgi:hypothetical protein
MLDLSIIILTLVDAKIYEIKKACGNNKEKIIDRHCLLQQRKIHPHSHRIGTFTNLQKY